MVKSYIYSIGYGSRKIDNFIFLLKKHSIDYLIDVRSIPFSKNNQEFNRNELTHYLNDHSIKYVFMGDLLGGRPSDESCYTSDGKVDYEKVKSKDFYRNGLERIKTAYEKGLHIALMCSEANPCHCHRSKLIGMSLIENTENKIFVQHIDEFDKIKDQALVMNEINKGKNTIDLFNESYTLTSRKSYTK